MFPKKLQRRWSDIFHEISEMLCKYKMLKNIRDEKEDSPNIFPASASWWTLVWNLGPSCEVLSTHAWGWSSGGYPAPETPARWMWHPSHPKGFGWEVLSAHSVVSGNFGVEQVHILNINDIDLYLLPASQYCFISGNTWEEVLYPSTFVLTSDLHLFYWTLTFFL